ncbi:MAG: T9SS type A sorting domain-containing protein [Flavobacteriales bacterium]|nr:T9SS type A sorting domain-containing protein [Flavobacteriales bacterium]
MAASALPSWLLAGLLVAASAAHLNGTCPPEACAPPPRTCSDWKVIVDTDDDGDEITWEVIDAASGLPVASGGPYMDHSHNEQIICLTAGGCYRLTVHDSGGDGIDPGGYALEAPTGARVIDNSGNGSTYGSTSAIMNNLGFCDPVGADRPLNSQPQSASCSRLDYLTNDYFIATPNPAVNPANGDGYQFWIFDPNGTYTRRVFQTGTLYNGWSDTDPNDACYLRFGWLQTNPVPLNVLLNLAVRTKINGVYGNFGAVCQVKVLNAPPSCSPTRLVDQPLHPNFSCGVTRMFGAADQIHAISLSGATDYRFRFETDGGGFVRQIASNGSSLTLNWLTLPLQDASIYDVTVAPSFNGGISWCPYGPVCQVMIDNTPSAAPRSMSASTAALSLFPVPCTNALQVEGLGPVPWRIRDLQGRTLLTGQGHGLGPETLDVSSLASGSYVFSAEDGPEKASVRFVKE